MTHSIHRIVAAHQKQSAVSEMLLTAKVNPLFEKLRRAATSLIVLHPVLSSEGQKVIDVQARTFEHLLQEFTRDLSKLDAALAPLWKSVEPGRRSAIQRTQQSLGRAFK